MTSNLTTVHTGNITVDNIPEDEYPFENFAPTLAQCYFIVSIGYILGKFGPLSKSDIRGVCAFASYFAMPAIICVSLADASFSDFHWQLLVGIIVGKAIIFAVVAAIVISIKKPCDTTLAGIYAMFCTQCNDLPVGNPLMSSLYRFVRPHMMKYLFFLPSLTMIIFGPISYLMIDCNKDGKSHSNKNTKVTNFLEVKKVSRKLLEFCRRGILLNPVVIATVTGVLLNLIFQAKIPAVLRHPIHVLAETIPGIALCILGFNIIGRESHLASSGIVQALVIALVKMVLTPIVLHTVVRNITFGVELPKELCDFALLYGIIPPATIIFEEVTKRKIGMETMSASLMITSFSCFPLSYAIAKLTIVQPEPWSTYANSYNLVVSRVSCANLIFGTSTIILIWWKKLWRKMFHIFVQCLLIFQLLISCGALLSIMDNRKTAPWMQYIDLAISAFGEVGSCAWMAVTVTFVTIQRNQKNSASQTSIWVLFIAAGCFSVLSTVAIIVMKMREQRRIDFYEGCTSTVTGSNQLLLMSTILTISITIMIICIVLYHRRENRRIRGAKIEKSDGRKFSAAEIYFTSGASVSTTLKDDNKDVSSSTYDISKSSNTLFVENDMSNYYHAILQRKTSCPSFSWTDSQRYKSLLTLQTLIIAVRLLRNFYRLFDCTNMPIIVPLEYLQAILFFGQSAIPFIIFGIDVRTMKFSIIKWCRALKHKRKMVHHLETAEQESINEWCSYFLMNYYSLCFADLARDRTWKSFQYKSSFWGHQMVKWILSVGLAKDLEESELMGQKLLLGGIIQHVHAEHNFHNAPYLYCFVPGSSHL